MRLAAEDVRAVKLALVDLAGIHRVKCVPLQRLRDVITSGVGLSTLVSVWMVNDVFATCAHVGPDRPQDDLRLMPDLSSAVSLAAEPGWAWCAVDQYDQLRRPWAACPRGFLTRMVGELAEAGLRLSGAFETEWYYERPGCDGHSGPHPASDGPAYSAIATTSAGYLLDLCCALESAGVDVEQFHAEYSPGQYEISVGPRGAVEAADTVALVRQSIRGVGARHGLQALFAPVVRSSGLGNGAHFHLSLWDGDGRNIFGAGGSQLGMTPEAEAFLSGVFAELPALVAVTAPSVPSYQRLRPGSASGAYQAWGYENREAALRFVSGMVGNREQSSNIEYKPIDAAANPYLAIGAIIAAGLNGIRRNLPLPEPTSIAPATLSQSERERLGLSALPGTLGEAVSELNRSAVLREAMGDVLFDTFVATRLREWETYDGQDAESVIHAHRARY